MSTADQLNHAADIGDLRNVQTDAGSMVLFAEATPEQREAVLRTVKNYSPDRTERSVGAVYLLTDFTLPSGYIAFVLRDHNDILILNGGVDREGSVST